MGYLDRLKALGAVTPATTSCEESEESEESPPIAGGEQGTSCEESEESEESPLGPLLTEAQQWLEQDLRAHVLTLGEAYCFPRLRLGGHLATEAGREAWERFAATAPADLLQRVVDLLPLDLDGDDG